MLGIGHIGLGADNAVNFFIKKTLYNANLSIMLKKRHDTQNPPGSIRNIIQALYYAARKYKQTEDIVNTRFPIIALTPPPQHPFH